MSISSWWPCCFNSNKDMLQSMLAQAHNWHIENPAIEKERHEIIWDIEKELAGPDGRPETGPLFFRWESLKNHCMRMRRLKAAAQRDENTNG